MHLFLIPTIKIFKKILYKTIREKVIIKDYKNRFGRIVQNLRMLKQDDKIDNLLALYNKCLCEVQKSNKSLTKVNTQIDSFLNSKCHVCLINAVCCNVVCKAWF